MAGNEVPPSEGGHHGSTGPSRGVGSSSSRRREWAESGGGSSRSSQSHSFSRRLFGGTGSNSSSSSDDDFGPHRSFPRSNNRGNNESESLRVVFNGRSVDTDEAAENALDGREDLERRHVFFSLLDWEGPSGIRSTSERLSGAPGSSSAGMLPGVEVARRRRVRGPESYEAGGFGVHEAGQSNRSSRSGVTVAHHHHHYHHHHHHHVHHQATRNPSRPGTPRPGSLVRRMQDILQEHRARNPFQSVSSSVDRGNASEGRSNPHIVHRSSRGQGHRAGESESRSSPFSSLWRRQSSDTNLRGAALDARNRLDERLRAAAHASSSSRRHWQAVQASYDMHFVFSDDNQDSLWSDDDSWETSLHEWLAAWGPSVEERWNRMESSSSTRAGSSTSRMPSFKPRSSEGLSKAAINALPRQVVGSIVQGDVTRGKLEQEDCPVCLEGFVVGQSLMSLPCNHRFHPGCLTPWLANHGQCPYCRSDILKESDSTEHKNSSSVGNDEDLLSWVEAIERGMDRLSYF